MRSLNRWFVWLSAPTRYHRALPATALPMARIAEARSIRPFARDESALNMSPMRALPSYILQRDAPPRKRCGGRTRGSLPRLVLAGLERLLASL
jgi:hypothetical protein